jgi:glycosyltransferase involved in cell wall biosynthesis
MLQGGIYICATHFDDIFQSCLTSLTGQETAPGFDLTSVTIVWNGMGPLLEADIAKTMEWAEKNWSAPFSLTHIREDRWGIPFARNRALEHVTSEKLDWLAFIDSDCVAHPGWLFALTERAKSQAADVVAGSWVIESRGEPSSWLPRHLFGLKHYVLDGTEIPDGGILPNAYTRNVFLHSSVLEKVDKHYRRFDESMAQTGGSDVMFFSELHRAGAVIIACHTAQVSEIYRGDRLTLRWQANRRLRNTQLLLARAPRTGEKTVKSPGSVNTLAHLFWRIPLSLLLMPLALSRRVRRFVGVTVLWTAPYVAAALYAVGIRFEEYANRFVLRRAPQLKKAQRDQTDSRITGSTHR